MEFYCTAITVSVFGQDMSFVGRKAFNFMANLFHYEILDRKSVTFVSEVLSIKSDVSLTVHRNSVRIRKTN